MAYISRTSVIMRVDIESTKSGFKVRCHYDCGSKIINSRPGTRSDAERNVQLLADRHGLTVVQNPFYAYRRGR